MTKNVVMILLFLLFTSILYSQTVSILYFNDAHEIAPVIDDYGERGGFARLKTIIDSIKIEDPNTLVVFGGDCAGGTLFGALYHGLPQIEAFNMLPVDIANFGQHDFDFGIENNLKLIENSSFEWITSNLIFDDGSPYAGLNRYKILSFAGIKIGFIGLTDAMGTTRKTEGIRQLDLINATGQVLELMKQDAPDVVIAVTQTGFETNKLLLEKFPDIDAVLTEESSETITEISYIGDRPVISPCGNIGSVARLDITKEAEHITAFVTAYTVDRTVQPNPEMQVLENKYQRELEEKLGEELTFLRSPLIAGITTDHASRWKETNVGNLLTDSFREYYQADIAILNGGGIRADIQEGSFTVKDAIALIPFGNRICLVEMSGEDILQILEHGASATEKKSGRFLQISGASYSYDAQKAPYQRIERIFIGTESLDTNRLYTTALPDYILNGGDGFIIPENINIAVSADDAPKDIEIFVQYLTNKEFIDPQLEGRISIVKSKE